MYLCCLVSGWWLMSRYSFYSILNNMIEWNHTETMIANWILQNSTTYLCYINITHKTHLHGIKHPINEIMPHQTGKTQNCRKKASTPTTYLPKFSPLPQNMLPTTRQYQLRCFLSSSNHISTYFTQAQKNKMDPPTIQPIILFPTLHHQIPPHRDSTKPLPIQRHPKNKQLMKYRRFLPTTHNLPDKHK